MKKVFLETHNINNQYSGFGQFNLHLLKGLFNNKTKDIKYVVHTKNPKPLKELFGNYFKYKQYFGFRRYENFRVRTKYDIWHSLNQNTKVEPHTDVPYVLTVHDVNFVEEVSADMNHPRNIAFKEKIARSNHITYISEYAKNVTHEHFEIPENVDETVILNGNPVEELLDLTNFTPETKVEGPYLFSIGAFLDRKNFHALVAMMPLLKDYKLIIAGANDKPYGDVVRAKITELNLEDQVILAGRISEEEKQYHLKNAAAFVFPSLSEGFGLPPIEAMRFGTPVFLANKTSLPEIGGDQAFYWKEFSPEYMAKIFLEGMATFHENEENYKEQLKQHALSFNWDTAAKQYQEVYKKVLGL